MLNVLHDLPSTAARRRGYRSLDIDEEVSETSPLRGDEDLESDAIAESAQHDSWKVLIWSFVVSSIMTVGLTL